MISLIFMAMGLLVFKIGFQREWFRRNGKSAYARPAPECRKKESRCLADMRRLLSDLASAQPAFRAGLVFFGIRLASSDRGISQLDEMRQFVEGGNPPENGSYSRRSLKSNAANLINSNLNRRSKTWLFAIDCPICGAGNAVS